MTATQTIQPSANTGPFTRARVENRTRITAMIGTGLIATPIANGRTSLIALPMVVLAPFVPGSAEVAGIEPTGRGSPVPLVLKTRGATRPRSPPGAGLPVSLPSGQRPSTRRSVVKKLLVLLILVAIGIAVARKVREV